MMRSLVAGLMLSLVVFSGSVRGSVYDYTVYGMNVRLGGCELWLGRLGDCHCGGGSIQY